MDQYKTPLWDNLKKYVEDGIIPYHMPGHKQGLGIHNKFHSFVGTDIFKIDLTEVEGLDDLHNPRDVIYEAQKLAAEAFGADRSFFLVNGATVGIEALLMSLDPGDKVIIPRNMHQSALNGIILSGVKPIYIWPDYNQYLNIVMPVHQKQIEECLIKTTDTKALFLINPTYQGISNNIRDIIQTVRQRGIIVMVDEAHGPHFNFHPRLPDSALRFGADACVHGAHKLIGALTQAAYLHIAGEKINVSKIRAALQLLQTTSPSYLLMASLDVARMQMSTNGRSLLSNAIEVAEYLRQEINQMPGLYSFTKEDLSSIGDFNLDLTKVTVNVSDLSINGFQVLSLLRKEYYIQAEMADTNNVLFLVTIGDSWENVAMLKDALGQISRKYYNKTTIADKSVPKAFTLPRPHMGLTPREAWLSKSTVLPLSQAVGKISAEPVVPYPPGIPLIYPGEILDNDIIVTIKRYINAGFSFHGTEDNTLSTIKVVS